MTILKSRLRNLQMKTSSFANHKWSEISLHSLPKLPEWNIYITMNFQGMKTHLEWQMRAMLLSIIGFDITSLMSTILCWYMAECLQRQIENIHMVISNKNQWSYVSKSYYQFSLPEGHKVSGIDPSMRDNSRRLTWQWKKTTWLSLSVMKACNLLYVPGFWNGLLGRDLL